MRYAAAILLLTLQGVVCHGFADEVCVLQLRPAFDAVTSINFGLQSACEKIEAREGDRIQAAAYPNPSLELLLDDIGRRSGDDENELFLGLSQLVELGGKRPARMRLAKADLCVADWDYQIEKNELFNQFLHSFISLASSQEKIALVEKQEKIAHNFLTAVTDRLRFGKSSAIEEKKAEVELKMAKIALNKEQIRITGQRKELGAFWNNSPPHFDKVDYPLYRLIPPPSIQCLESLLEGNLEIQQAAARTARALEAKGVEKSRRIPNVAFQVGVSTERFVEEPALAVGLEIPLPLFDTNQGNVIRASHEYMQAIYEQLEIETQLKARLLVNYQEWLSSYEEAKGLREVVLPTAEESFELAITGYKEGKFNYLHVLEANNTLISVREQLLNAVTEYHHNYADILKLIGAIAMPTEEP